MSVFLGFSSFRSFSRNERRCLAFNGAAMRATRVWSACSFILISLSLSFCCLQEGRKGVGKSGGTAMTTTMTKKLKSSIRTRRRQEQKGRRQAISTTPNGLCSIHLNSFTLPLPPSLPPERKLKLNNNDKEARTRIRKTDNINNTKQCSS